MGRLIKKKDIVAPCFDIENFDQRVHDFAVKENYNSQLIRKSKKHIIELALEMAQKIVQQKLESDDKALAELFAQVLARHQSYESKTITLHPDALKISGVKEIFKNVAITVLTDSSFEKGDCVIESLEGKIDCRLKTALHVFEKVLLEQTGLS